MASVYLYSPPTWRMTTQLEGGLVVGFPVSTLVYRMAGTWYNQLEGYADNPVVADIDVDPDTSLLLYFTGPVVVPGTLHDGLSALEPADPSWTPGSLMLL